MITSNTSWFVFNFFRSAITEFMKDGNQVFVLAPKDAYTQRLIDLGCNYQELTMSRSGINIFQEIKTLHNIYQTYKDIRPDAILNFTPKINIYSALSGKLLKIPTVNSIAGLGSIFTEKGLKSYLGKLLLKMTQPLADHVIFQNPDDWGVYLDKGYVKKTSSSRVPGIGVNLEQFRSYQAQDDGVVRFVLIARMLYTKGVEEFIEAALQVDEHYCVRKKAGYKVPEVTFSLLGFIDEGNPQGIPLHKIQRWHDTTLVNYLGETDDVFSKVKNKDCIVLPSYYREGVPQCLIEAASMAKPIITTDNVGCRETVEHNHTGFIIKSRSVPELKDAMIKMANLSHQERLTFGKKGREKAEHEFCHIKISKHYLKTIERVIEEA